MGCGCNGTCSQSKLRRNNYVGKLKRPDPKWAYLPSKMKIVTVDAEQEIGLGNLLSFWKEYRYLNTGQNWAHLAYCACWHLASHYYHQGNFRAASNLLLNGAFVGEAFVVHYSAPNDGYDVISKNLSSMHMNNQELVREKKFEELDRLASQRFPCLYDAYVVRSNIHLMEHYLEKLLATERLCTRVVFEKWRSEREFFDLVFLEGTKEYTMKMGKTMKLKKGLNIYAEKRETPLRLLRFVRRPCNIKDCNCKDTLGTTLFLSLVGNKTPNELGILPKGGCNGTVSNPLINVILLAEAGNAIDHAADDSSRPKAYPKSSKRKDKYSSKKRNRRRQINEAQLSHAPQVIEKSEEELKIEHSKMLTKLHEEAQPQLKRIRQQLNNLLIERCPPKVKTRAKRDSSRPQPSMMMNPSTEGLAGKAGKTHYLVQVGEVANLYKTSKRRHPATIQQQRQKPKSKLDLHGMKREDALKALDEKLTQWIDDAMSGPYPFVIPVEIVCGGGSQILSEAVEQWVKQNEKVANAPRNSQ